MSNFIELNDLPEYDLLTDFNFLYQNKKISWPDSNQICLNTIVAEPTNYLKGTSSLTHDWDNAIQTTDEYGNNKLTVPLYKNPLHEKDFTILCKQFENTAFEKIYNLLSQKYKLGRVRLMKSTPKSCLSWHTDSSPRIHYPIKTQEGCFMVIENEVTYLKANKWYWTNTLKSHTAFNASKEDRIHLVAVILG
jgi:hypothetical protein